MVVNGYYVWLRRDGGNFETRFLPTTDYTAVERYFKSHEELEYMGARFEEKTFKANEKEDLFNLMLELNNL